MTARFSAALLWLLLCLLPSALALTAVWFVPPRRAPVAVVMGTALLGSIAGVAVALAQGFVGELTGLAQSTSIFGAPSGLLFVLAFSAPLAEGSKVAAAWPAFRSSHFDEEFDGILYSIATATGFAVGQSAVDLFGSPTTFDSVLRVELLLVAHPLMSPIWGHAMGKARRTRTPSTRFVVSWTFATLVHGLLLYLTRATSLLAVVAAFPVFGVLALSTWLAARDLLARYGKTSRISARVVLPSSPPPSLQAIRHALRKTEEPIHFRWIAIGTLTTAGVMLAMVAVAVWVGHRAGLDFSAIERDDTTARAIAPLVLLTLAVLAAFPVSGYLITKACRSGGVLESAIASACAIVAVLTMLGVAAPVALVFALAFAPIAFALACTGAWFGLGK